MRTSSRTARPYDVQSFHRRREACLKNLVRMRAGNPLLVVICCLVSSACMIGDKGTHGATSSLMVPSGPIPTITSSDPTPSVPILQTPTLFTIRTLGSRCVDAGRRSAWAPGAPVVIRDCDASEEGQRILIGELDQATHDVELRVGSFASACAATGRTGAKSEFATENRLCTCRRRPRRAPSVQLVSGTTLRARR